MTTERKVTELATELLDHVQAESRGAFVPDKVSLDVAGITGPGPTNRRAAKVGVLIRAKILDRMGGPALNVELVVAASKSFISAPRVSSWAEQLQRNVEMLRSTDRQHVYPVLAVHGLPAQARDVLGASDISYIDTKSKEIYLRLPGFIFIDNGTRRTDATMTLEEIIKGKGHSTTSAPKVLRILLDKGTGKAWTADMLRDKAGISVPAIYKLKKRLLMLSVIVPTKTADGKAAFQLTEDGARDLAELDPGPGPIGPRPGPMDATALRDKRKQNQSDPSGQPATIIRPSTRNKPKGQY